LNISRMTVGTGDSEKYRPDMQWKPALEDEKTNGLTTMGETTRDAERQVLEWSHEELHRVHRYEPQLGSILVDYDMHKPHTPSCRTGQVFLLAPKISKKQHSQKDDMLLWQRT